MPRVAPQPEVARVSMYTSPDDARSDLFLAGAVYLFGPILIQILFGQLLPIGRVPALALALAFITPLVTTVLVPWLLMRYRGETLRDFGVGIEGAGLPMGVLVALPAVAVGVLVAVIGGRSPLDPFFAVTPSGTGQLLLVVARLMQWLGLIALGVYCTVKARDAFRYVPRTLRAGTLEIGRWIAIAAGVTSLLLVLFLPPQVALAAEIILMPVGVAGVVWLALRQVSGPTSVSRSVLLTPVVLFALRPFVLFAAPIDFIQGAWNAAVVGGVGLAVAVLLEGRRSALPAIGLGLAIALLTSL